MIGLNIIIKLTYVSLQASTDQSAVDLRIPYQVASFSFSMIQHLGIIAVMSQVAWQVFIVFIPVIATSIWYQVYHLTLSEYWLKNYWKMAWSHGISDCINNITICYHANGLITLPFVLQFVLCTCYKIS